MDTSSISRKDMEPLNRRCNIIEAENVITDTAEALASLLTKIEFMQDMHTLKENEKTQWNGIVKDIKKEKNKLKRLRCRIRILLIGD